MCDWSPQEDLLVVEALIEYSCDREFVQPTRSNRAWLLAEELAATHGLEVEDALRQRTELENFRETETQRP